MLTAPQPLSASFYSLLEGLLFYLTEVHSLGSLTGDNLYRLSNCSGAPVDFFTHNKVDVNSLVRRDSMATSNKQLIFYNAS